MEDTSATQPHLDPGHSAIKHRLSHSTSQGNPEGVEWLDEERNDERLDSASPRAVVYVKYRKLHMHRKGTVTGLRRAGHQRVPTTKKGYQATAEPIPVVQRPYSPSLPRPRLISADDLVDYVIMGIHWTFRFGLSVVASAIGFFKLPLAMITFAIFVTFSITRIYPSLTATIGTTLCHYAIVSSIPTCSAYVKTPSELVRTVRWADYPALMEVQSKTFEQMLDDFVIGSTTPSSLSLDLKKTEMATMDLIALVRISNLKSRECLSGALGEFVVSARGAGRALARLDAKMNGAMDDVMAMNDYALHAIEEARANEISQFVAFLMPWRSGKSAKEVVKESFLGAMNVLSESLERMVLEAEVNRQNLDALEEQLGSIRQISIRENAAITADREELLSYLWTQLGGNRKDLKNFDRNLAMLSALTHHRKAAQARVAAMLHVLQGVSHDMEDMRERVAAPNLAGSKVTPEIHMRSIRNGLERLREGRRGAKGVEEEARWKTLSASPWDLPK